jgi:hypothetical protein
VVVVVDGLTAVVVELAVCVLLLVQLVAVEL